MAAVALGLFLLVEAMLFGGDAPQDAATTYGGIALIAVGLQLYQQARTSAEVAELNDRLTDLERRVERSDNTTARVVRAFDYLTDDGRRRVG